MIIPVVGKTGTGKSTLGRMLATALLPIFKKAEYSIIQAEPTVVSFVGNIINPHRITQSRKDNLFLIYPLAVTKDEILPNLSTEEEPIAVDDISDTVTTKKQKWGHFNSTTFVLIDGLQAIKTPPAQRALGFHGFDLSTVDLLIDLGYFYDNMICTINWDDYDYVLGRGQGIVICKGRASYEVRSPYDRANSVVCSSVDQIISAWFRGRPGVYDCLPNII